MAKKVLWVVLLVACSIPAWSQKILSLEDCIDIAKKNNIEINNKNKEIESAESKIGEARSGLFPRIDLIGQYQYYFESPSQLIDASAFGGPKGQYKKLQFSQAQSSSAALNVQMNLYNQSIFQGLKAANSYLNVANYQYMLAKENMTYNISATYYIIQTFKQNIKMLDDNIKSLSKTAEAMKLMKDNEIVSKNSFKRISISLENLNNEKTNLELNKMEYLNMLKFLLNMEQSALIDIEEINENYNSELTNDNINRTDLKLQNEITKLSEISVDAAKSEYYPSLSLVLGYNLNGNYGEFNPLKTINDEWLSSSYMALKLSVPIFDGLSKYYKVKQKEIDLEINKNNYEMMRKNADKEIADAINGVKSNLNSLENNKRNLKLAEEIYNSSRIEFENGLISITDLLQSQDELSRARTNYTNAIINLKISELKLKKSTGNLN